MSFGPYDFHSDMTPEDTKGPFFIFWAVIVIGSLISGFAAIATAREGTPGGSPIITLLFYCAVGVAYVNFLTHYYKAAVEWMSIGDITFQFDADFKDWMGFYLRTIGLTIVTIGFAIFVYNFRKWQFITSHLNAFGTVDVDQLIQSQTVAPREAEGFLDALDIGAF